MRTAPALAPARAATLAAAALVSACSAAAPPPALVPDPTPSTRTVITRLGPVAVHERGAGAPVVLLHAIGHDHRDFDAIVPTLAASHHVLAVDWPGHGGSPAPASPATLSATDFADALEDLTAALDLGPAAFLGNSVGGFAAARLAARHPERVSALVLVDPGGFGELGWLERAFCRVKGTETVTRWVWNAFPAHYLVVRNEHTAAILERVRAAETPDGVRVQAAVWRSFTEPGHDLRGEAASIRAPTLIAWGEDDPVLPVADGARAAALIPGAHLVRFPTGHMPFVEAPEAFLAAVEPFLASAP